MTLHQPITSTIRSAAFAAAALCSLASAQVELRGGAFVDQPVERVSAAGVLLAADGARPARTLGWHEVKRVGGDLAPDAEAFARLSEDLWRATARLERGDIALAAPIFERLWTNALDNERDPHTVAAVLLEGPTGLAIAQGAAAVRIAQGAHAEAVEPWAASIALRRSISGEAADAAPTLNPSLPPIFVRSVAVERLAAREPTRVIEQDDRAAALFAIYQAAASLACGAEPQPSRGESAASDAAFARDIVAAQGNDDGTREDALLRLRETIRQQPGDWREAWSRAAVGIAAVKHSEGRDRLAGAVDLLHVPARFSASQPYLAGVALAWASVALTEERDQARADALREELETRHPFSPAIGWLARRDAIGGDS